MALRFPSATQYPDYHYSAHVEHRCDPETVSAFRGVLIAVALSTPMWGAIFWLIL